VTVPENTSGRPSMVKAMSPSTLRSKPVAVMMMSAVSSSPAFSRMPFSVNDSISSVTMEAFPEVIPANRSPSGT
jgi:hypothetical protein